MYAAGARRGAPRFLGLELPRATAMAPAPLGKLFLPPTYFLPGGDNRGEGHGEETACGHAKEGSSLHWYPIRGGVSSPLLERSQKI